MTVTTYALGKPPAATMRGGDCRARDITQARNVHGGHRFAATTDCQVSNGLLRLTIGVSGAAPSLTVDAWHGAGTGTVSGDYYVDTYSDTYSGVSSVTVGGWTASGVITIDSPAVSALLTAVRIVKVNHRLIVLRLVAPLMADAYLTLRQGWRAFNIQHGSTRSPFVVTTRRVSWAATSLTGSAATSRVEETAPLTDGYARFVAALDAGASTNAGAFSVTSPSARSFRFGAGVGTTTTRDTAADHHGQLADTSRLELVIA